VKKKTEEIQLNVKKMKFKSLEKEGLVKPKKALPY